MTAREPWFRYKRVFGSFKFWPCHWKGFALWAVAAWVGYAIIYAGTHWISKDYFFVSWLFVAVVFITAFVVGVRRAEEVS